MQVEVQRIRRQYVASGLRVQSSKALNGSMQDDVLGFDVPRRQRTSTTRPRDISPLELWFLSVSKISTQSSSPVPELTEDGDEEALVAAALFDLANAGPSGPSAGSRGGAVTAGLLTAPPPHKRNGTLYSSTCNGRTAPALPGAGWHTGAGPTKRRRSHDLLAGEDDYVDGDDGDGAHQGYDDLHSSPSGPLPQDDVPYHYTATAGARRGRSSAHVPAGPSGRGSLANGRHYPNDGRNAVMRSGRGPRPGPAYADEQYDTKPPLLPALPSRPGSGPRGAPNCALYGQATIAAARAATRAHPASEKPVGPHPPADQHDAAAGSRLGARPGLVVKSESGAERMGGEEAAEQMEESLRRRQGSGSGDGQLEVSAELAEGAGGARSHHGMSYSSGALAVKAEAGAGSSGPVSPGADAGCPGTRVGAAVRERYDPGSPAAPLAGPGGAPAGGCGGEMGGGGGQAANVGKAAVSLPGVPSAPHPLAELLAGVGAASGGPLGPWPPLAGLLPAAASAHQWTAAAELMAKGFSDAATKAAAQHPLAAPPHTHANMHPLHQLHLQQQQQQQQQQQAALKAAAAAGVPLAAGLPPGSLELLRTAALSGHPHPLQVAAAAAAAACGAPPGVLGAPGPGGVVAGLSGLAASSAPVASAANGATGGGAGAPGVSTGSRIPFKRCAQHVYIAHFIARQQHLQQQQQKTQPAEPRQGSASGGNGATSSRRTHSDPNRAGSGSPVRKASMGPVQEASAGGGEASGGAGGVAQSPGGTSSGNGGGGVGTSSGSRLQQPHSTSLPGAESAPAGVAPRAVGAGGNCGTRAAVQHSGNKSDPDAPAAGANNRRSLQLVQAQLQQQQQQAAAALTAAAVAAAAPGVGPAGPAPLFPPPGFQLPSPAAAAAAMMAAVANGGLGGVQSAQQSHALAAAMAAAAVAGGAGGPLVLPRGGPGPAPAPPHVAGPIGVVPQLPSHIAQLLIGAPPAGAPAATASYGLPAFISGLAAATAGGAPPLTAGGAAAGGGAPGFPPGGPAAAAAALSAAAAAVAAAGVMPAAAGPPGAPLAAAAAAASQLAPFFGGVIPPHFAVAPGAGLAPAPPGVVLPSHLSQSAAVHQLAAAWQQQAGQ